jgi:hypothetical protein
MEVGPADERLSGPGGGIGLGCWVAYNTGQLHQVLERYLDRRLPSVLNGKSLDIPVIIHTQIEAGASSNS